MKKKVFSLMMTLLLAFMGVAKADVVTIGEGTGTTYYFPIDNFFNYSCTEQIYLASEIGTAGTINAISFYYNYGTAYTASNVTMYMKNVSRSVFEATTDYEPLSAGDIVWNGTIAPNGAGWYTFTLDTPFQYDGTSNLLVAFYDGTSGYPGTSYTWLQTTSPNSAYMALRYYSDSYNPDPYNLGSYSGSKTWYTYRANVQIDITAGSYAEEVVEIGQGTTSSSYIFPFNSIWGYSFEEEIYLGSEINHAAGNITKVAYKLSQTYSTAQIDHIEIFMKNVSRSSFASGTDFEAVTAADKVYDGDFNIPANTTGWITITLDTPFYYDGTSNLLIGMHENTPGYSTRTFYTTSTSPNSMSIQCYSDSGDMDPLTPSTYPSSSCQTERADIQLTMRVASDEPEYEAGLHTLATYGVGDDAEELIDVLHIQRPNNAWMEPYHFQLYNDGDHSLDVVYIDFLHNNGYFSMDEETTEYPFTVVNNGLEGAVDLYINTNTAWTETEVINSLLAVNTDERSTHLFEIIAEPYEPYCPDVVEKAYNIGTLTTGQTWRMYASDMWAEHNPNVPYDLHDNYTLPFPEIPEGYDAVMKFVANHDIMLNAYVNDGENGKVALYRADFAGEAGPMADNNYTGRPFINVPAGEQPPYEAQLGAGTSTSGYLPFYCFYNYSISAQLYRADELAAAGVNTAPMTSISYECAATNGNNQNGITIWMANVNDNEVPSTSPLASGMTKVYEGSCTPVVGWNEFVFNQGNFAWDGSSNIMVLFQRNNGSWASGISWKVEAQSYTAGGYSYNDSDGAYNMMNNSYVFGSSGSSYGGTTTNRANTIFKSEGGRELITIAPGGQQQVAYPVNFIWAYTENQMILTAAEIGTDGMITSVAYKRASEGSGNPETRNIDIYMMHTTMNEYASTADWIPVSASNRVFSGNYTFQTTGTDWQTITLDTPFAYNGTDNLLICIDDNSGTTTTRQYWSCHSTPVARGMRAWGNDNFDPTAAGTPVGGSSLTGTFVADIQLNIDDQIVPIVPGDVEHNYSAGPIIENLNVLAGTYYLVASSTDPDFEVVINAEELPCPIEAVTNIYPEDNAWGIPSSNLTLYWTLNDYANEWRIVFGSTYYPEDEPNHPATYISEWSSNLQESLRITDYVELWDNTNYFWRIEQRSNPGTPYECVTSGPVFGFTTTFDIPQNLQVNGAGETNIFETEQDVTLTWNRIYDRNRNNDRTFRRYRIYWNGELYHETTDNNVTELSYTIPNSEFHYNMVPHVPELFNVTAVYDEGESPMSNTVAVHVSGYGTISGTAYEQDGVTPIGGVTVVINGTNEFGEPEEYTFTTNAQGYYEGEVHVGVYDDAMAYMEGYQATQTVHPLPFNIVYQQETPNVDFIIDETFYYPAHVCARPVYVPGVEGDTLVQVWWEGWASDDSPYIPGGSFEVQIGEGTSTTGYFPFYTLYNYGVHTALYRAEELMAAGVTGAPMTSLSWYATNSISENQTGITIWMANVTDNEVPATSPLASGMTKVYTGSLNYPTPTGWVEFTFNEGTFSWDGTSNILILCQRNCGDWTSSIQWQYEAVNFNAIGYVYQDSNPYNVETQTYSLSRSGNRPNIIMKAGGGREEAGEMNRALHHFNIYRTDCYNDGPYNSDNTTFLASVWRPDTSYFDVQWPEVPVGVYKYGVSAVYQGNQADNPNNPRVDYPFEPRESEIMWSDLCGPCIDKDMQTDITVNVVCNSADSPEGCVVSFTNLNEGEQFNHPQPSITLDASGFQAITPFRKGDYLVTVYLPGYELLQVEESIWGHRDLRYVLTEIIYGVKNLYVSRTGWAMWEPLTWEDYPVPTGAITGPSIIDFETGDFSQFGFDNTIGTYHWTVAQEGQDGGYCMKSGNSGVASSTSTIEATVNYTSAGIITFDYNSRGEGTSWDVSKFMIDGVQQFSYGAVGTWNSFSAEVAAGEHTFTWSYTKDGSVNPTGDCFLVDNIHFNIGGSRAVAEERHLEGFKIMCTSLDDEPIFNHNTPVDQPFCQLSTVDPWSGHDMLLEGEYYKVKVATIYSTGQSDWCEPVIWQYEPCDHWGPVDEVAVNTNTQGNHIEWVFEHGHNQWIDPNDPGQGGGEASSFSENFDEGIPAGWTTIDADGDGLTWVSSMNPGVYHNSGVNLSGTGHNSSEAYVISGSYANQTGQALHPDNYFVSPQVTLGGVFSFYACAQDASYAAEHFGVAVSTTGTAAADFTTIQEWTLTAKNGGNVMSAGRSGNNRAQGAWYHYTVDLSAYQGQTGYVAIRHFNCTDMFILNVDDVEMNAGAKGGLAMYENDEVYRQYADNGVLLNFLAIDNYDFRAFLLYTLIKNDNFELTSESNYGQFVVTSDIEDFMTEFESVYANALADFDLLTKNDIFEKMTEWKNVITPQYFLSITMDLALSNNRVENDQCINSLPFCTSDIIEFEAANTSNTAQEEGMDDGCIGSSYNPSFYHMRIHTGGPFIIHMEGHDPNTGVDRDIDFCMWGPYTEQEVMSGYACTHLTGDKIMDCCYSAEETEDCYLGYDPSTHDHHGYSSHGTVNYHMPVAGEYYILMITNFSRENCVITFTKTEGEGETDCDIVTPSNIIGFLITQDGEYLDIVGPDEREYTDLGEFGEHEYCVRPIYPGPAILPDTNYYFSMGCPVCMSTNGEIVEVCDAGNPIYAEVSGDDQVHIYWAEQPEPEPGEEGDTFVYDFENSSLDGLTLIDADGDGNNWVLGSVAMSTGYGHNGSTDMILSKSYDNNTGALTPDNYIVFPQSNIVNGSTFSFYACGQDASWASEHFGIAVSTTGNTNASDFTTIAEYTMTAKGEKAVRDGRDQGNWYQYTVDLSDYAGMPVYIAIRHFNCTDMFYLDVDDVELSIAAKGNRDGIVAYNIYRSEDGVTYDLIATVDGDVTEYFDAPGAGTYYYQVTAVYADGCESDPAISGENPDVNYVMVGVTGIGENSDNVALFPNPTKGNVTIQAMNMHRITVVSVLGQVVFDTELDQDEYILNMAKFNTGMYMVRVYTDEGVTVKRVTVLH